MRSVASSPRCVSAPDCRSIASTRVVLPWSTWATMATLRKSTSASLAVWLPDHENERYPSLETAQARRPQAEEEVLPQQAPLQALPGGDPQGAKAELNGIRGKELEKIYKRARKS